MKKLLGLLFTNMIVCCTIAQIAATDSSKYPRLSNFSAQQDHANMMQQLGIKKLRPGPSGNESDSNHANYNETLADPCPKLPDPLITKKGIKVITPEQWWKQRRPEIAGDFEKEIYGSIPADVPKVNWIVKITDYEFVGRTPASPGKLPGRLITVHTH
jgi:hypothetical protein